MHFEFSQVMSKSVLVVPKIDSIAATTDRIVAKKILNRKSGKV